MALYKIDAEYIYLGLSWHQIIVCYFLYNSVFYDNEPYFERSLHFHSDIESAGATLYGLRILILKGFMDSLGQSLVNTF